MITLRDKIFTHYDNVRVGPYPPPYLSEAVLIKVECRTHTKVAHIIRRVTRPIHRFLQYGHKTNT